MATEETPAQPTAWVVCAASERLNVDGHASRAEVRDIAQRFWRTQANAAHGALAALNAGNATVERDAQPDVAPAPDGNAGGAGVEVYREAARRMHEVWGYVETMSPGEFELVAREYARQPGFRAAIDAARAPLLAEIERLTRANADLGESIGARAIDDAHAEREEMAGQLAEAIRERDVAWAEGERLQCGLGEILTHLTDIDHPAYQAYLRWLRREPAGDDARAKTDGGEWVSRYYGDAEQADRNEWWSTVRRSEYTHRRRVWIGPVEPVADDGSANGE